VSTLGVFCINNPQLGYGQISLWYCLLRYPLYIYIYAFSIYISIYLSTLDWRDGWSFAKPESGKLN
jgi:hypothetical protein